MGVKGLNRFITRFEKSVIDRINIREEIDNWKIDHNGKEPQILVDLKEAAHIFVQRDEIGLVLGGRFEQYNKKAMQFFSNLAKANVKLVFFMSGNRYTDDLQFFIPKRETEYMTCLELLDKIEENADLKAYLAEKNKISPDIRMPLAFDYNLKKLIRRFGDLHINYIQHNQEIARYAKQHADEVLAVISNDTDFMAFEGNFQYWNANSINCRDLTVNSYSKHKLHDKLGLNFHQMQLLSALCGSNFLPMFVINDWVKSLIETNGDPELKGKIKNVAMYVKRQPIELVKNKPTYDLDSISRDVFGPDYTKEQKNCIANGLACYELDLKEEPEPRISFLKFCKKNDHFMYKLATDDIFNVKDIMYIDYRNYRSLNYAELILPILMKMCGILLKDERRRPHTRAICVKHAHDEPYKVTDENIIYPDMKLPECFDLIFKNKERQFDKQRWELLEWVLDLDEGFVKKFINKKQPKFATVVLTLKYLVRHEALTAREANAILYTEYRVRNLGANQIEYPHTPNANFVRIAHLYVKMYVLVSHCLDVCGVHELTDLIQFDGAIFHRTMEKFDIANEEQLQSLNSTLQPIYVFS